MKRQIIEFEVVGVGVGLQAEAELSVGDVVGEVANTEGLVVPEVGLGAGGVAEVDPEFGVPVEDGPGPDLGGVGGEFEVELEEKGGDAVGRDIGGELEGEDAGVDDGGGGEGEVGSGVVVGVGLLEQAEGGQGAGGGAALGGEAGRRDDLRDG